jgi:competence protein ComEC
MQDTSQTCSQDFPQHPALWFAIAVSCGIVADKWIDASIATYFIAAAVASILSQLPALRQFPITRLIFCLTLIATAGAAWHHIYWNFYPQNEISRWASNQSAPACVKAQLLLAPKRVATDFSKSPLNRPRDQTQKQRLMLKCLAIRDGLKWQKASGNIQLTMPTAEIPLHAGDEVLAFGHLRKIGPPSNPGGFDFQSHYRRRRVLVSMHCSHAQSVELIKKTKLGSLRASLRSWLDRQVWRYLPAAQASLASAVLLGNREQLTNSRREAFLHTGTIHLLAISGLHVGILACCFFVLFRCGWMSRTSCLMLTIAFVVFYAWLVEFRPPVVRASILIILFCFARILGRAGLSYNVLALAALIILAINPTDLFSLGTQLSFLAVLSICFGNHWIFNQQTNPLKRLIASTRSWPVQIIAAVKDNVRAAFVISGLIWLISIPLVAANFHVLAPIGLLVNPLLLLPIAIALYAGLCIFSFGNFFSPVVFLAAMICTASLGFIETLVRGADRFPMSHFFTSGPPWISVIIFYFGWAVLGLFPPTRIPPKRLLAAGLAWLFLGWCLPITAHQFYQRHLQRSLITTFIDVGHGTAVLIQLPNGRNVIYDCGSTISSRFAAQSVSDVLWYYDITHIDAIVVSHADIDHFNGIPGIAKRFSIGDVYLSPMMNQHPSDSVAELKRSLNRYNIAVKELTAGDFINMDSDVLLQAIAPACDSQHRNDNSASIVLSVEYKNRRILLPGDLEKEGLEWLLTEPSQHFDLAMAPHHGSAHSSPLRFCQWATPQFLAVSCGNRKFSSATAAAATFSKCQLLRTDRDGAITFEIRRDGKMLFKSFSKLRPNEISLTSHSQNSKKKGSSD